uniref:Peptidase A2 domain-containing protein n=1 Tax=Trichuris muris TaxID=70415 RepID=A0A5S6QNV6_TRIMR
MDQEDGPEPLKKVQPQLIPNATAAPRLFVDACVNGIRVSMLVDTGAGRTLVSANSFKKICGHVHLQRSSVQLVLADGSPLHVVGEARLRIRLGSQNFPVLAVVVERLQYTAILGIDFLASHGFVVDLGRNILSCAKVSMQVPLLVTGNQAICEEESVYALESINIAPRSIAALCCCVKTEFSGEGMLESTQNLELHGGYVARSLVTVKNSKFHTFILNPTWQQVCVKKGTRLGKFSPMETEHVCTTAPAVKCEMTKGSNSALRIALLKLAREAADASLDQKQMNMLFYVLWRFRDVFAADKYDMGRTNVLRQDNVDGECPTGETAASAPESEGQKRGQFPTKSLVDR